MDRFGDHGLTCPCKGDRTITHNALRDVVAREAYAARMDPEKEKGGLLPARPVGDGAADAGQDNESEDGRRRPADIYLPRGAGGVRCEPAALDFAVTSGLRPDHIEQVITDPAGILCDYSEYKKAYKDTEDKLNLRGIQFLPLILEAHGGGWGAGLRQVAALVAARQKTSGEWCRESVSVRLAQRISSTLQRENARAILRRIGGHVPVTAEADLAAAWEPWP